MPQENRVVEVPSPNQNPSPELAPNPTYRRNRIAQEIFPHLIGKSVLNGPIEAAFNYADEFLAEEKRRTESGV